MYLVSVTKISSLMLAFVAEQASLSLPGRKLPKTRFLMTSNTHSYTHTCPCTYILTTVITSTLKVFFDEYVVR